jgi:hypothetical protein
VESSLFTTLLVGIVSALGLPFGLAGLAAAMTSHEAAARCDRLDCV